MKSFPWPQWPTRLVHKPCSLVQGDWEWWWGPCFPWMQHQCIYCRLTSLIELSGTYLEPSYLGIERPQRIFDYYRSRIKLCMYVPHIRVEPRLAACQAVVLMITPVAPVTTGLDSAYFFVQPRIWKCAAHYCWLFTAVFSNLKLFNNTVTGFRY